jgi:hypothetical protein
MTRIRIHLPDGGSGVVESNVGLTSLSPGEQMSEASNTMIGPCSKPTTSLESLSTIR